MPALSGIPLVNGNSYDWVSITFSLLGNFSVQGVTEIMYKQKQAKENNYASGKFPSSRGRGKISYESSIGLEEIEIRRILNAVPIGTTLKDIPPFTIVVSYLPQGAISPVVDVLTFCEFMDEGVEYKSGDTNGTRKCELIIAGITWGRPL